LARIDADFLNNKGTKKTTEEKKTNRQCELRGYKFLAAKNAEQTEFNRR